MNGLNNIKDRIRKLLDLADDNAAATGEIENAMRFADQMMARYNLSRDDISRGEDGEIDTSNVRFTADVRSWSTGVRMTSWESWLGTIVVSIVGSIDCYVDCPQHVRRNGIMQIDGNGQPVKRRPIVWYGPAEDVEIARSLYDEIQHVILSMARLRWGGFAKGDGARYCQGFVLGFRNANTRERDKARLPQGANEETAIILARSDERAIALREASRDWLRTEKGIRLGGGGRSAGAQAGSYEAHAEGMSDGSRYKAAGGDRRAKLEA